MLFIQSSKKQYVIFLGEIFIEVILGQERFGSVVSNVIFQVRM